MKVRKKQSNYASALSDKKPKARNTNLSKVDKKTKKKQLDSQVIIIAIAAVLLVLFAIVVLFTELNREQSGQDNEVFQEGALEVNFELLPNNNPQLAMIANQDIPIPNEFYIASIFRGVSFFDSSYDCETECLMFEIVEVQSDQTRGFLSAEVPILTNTEFELDVSEQIITFLNEEVLLTTLVTDIIELPDEELTREVGEVSNQVTAIQSYVCTSKNICVSSVKYSEEREQAQVDQEQFLSFIESF